MSFLCSMRTKMFYYFDSDEVRGQIHSEKFRFQMQKSLSFENKVGDCCEINITTVTCINMCQIRDFQVSLEN